MFIKINTFHHISVILIALMGFNTFVYSQDLKPSTLFKDHMVLQRDQAVPVWGKSSPNKNIKVTFANQVKTTKADKNGDWRITLDAMKASKEGRKLIISSKDEIVISDVLVGEVWICSGQVSLKEEDNVEGEWSTAYPNSSVAFSFAYFLKDLEDVPVGIILSCWGSSSIEGWTPKDMTDSLPHFKKIMREFDLDIATQQQIANIIAKKESRSVKEDIFIRRQPNILYNAMMKPLAPFACNGVVWYQGERNTRYLSGMPEVTKENWFHRVAGSKEYGGILKKWIMRYRQEWKNPEMKFMIVMLPGYGKGAASTPNIDPENPNTASWAWMRESQLQVLDLPYTSVANTIDLGDIKDIHPTDKLPIGQRLALLAMKNKLGANNMTSGPFYDKTEISKHSITVHFKNAEGLKTIDGKRPTAFWIADDTREWKKAEAEINKNAVILSSSEIEHPKYVRYAFAGKPRVNLVNKEELPAYPFRTDNFGQKEIIK